MGFECTDCPFICIAVMDTRQDKLVPCLPGFSDGLLVGRTELIVQHLEIHLLSAACEFLHGGIVCCNMVSVASRLEGGI